MYNILSDNLCDASNPTLAILHKFLASTGESALHFSTFNQALGTHLGDYTKRWVSESLINPRLIPRIMPCRLFNYTLAAEFGVPKSQQHSRHLQYMARASKKLVLTIFVVLVQLISTLYSTSVQFASEILAK